MGMRVWIMAMALAMGACGSKESSSGEAATKDNAAATAGKAAESKAADIRTGDDTAAKGNKPKSPDSIAETDAQKVLDDWLAAQNTGDFAAYDKLYAGQFFGVKRVGANKTTYDRAGWLEDRGRMFKNKMVVEADGVTISTNPRSAVVHFTQSFSSGKFRDVGPKQLIVIVEGGDLKISREEMLQSQPAPALAAWVKAEGGQTAPIEGAKLPDDVKKELTRISDGLAGEKQKLGAVDWAMPLSAELVAYQIQSDRNQNDSEEAPYWDRGATSHLVLARSDRGRFIVASVASEQGTGFELSTRDDYDGDGVKDAVFTWQWYHDHEGATGIATILSKTRTVSMLQLGESGGESGWFGHRIISDLCWTRLDGELALVMAYVDETGEPEDEDNPHDSDTIERAAPGFAVYSAGKTGVFRDVLAFAAWVTEAASVAGLEGRLNGHRAGGTSDVPKLSPCKADGRFAVDGQATSTLKEGAYVVRDLSLSRAAAERKAAAAKQPADRVLELGDWQRLMKRKHNQPHSDFQMPRKKKAP